MSGKRPASPSVRQPPLPPDPLLWAPGVTAVNDLRGASRLVVDAVAGVTGIVEDMHRNIAGRSPVVGEAPSGGARGVSGFVYRTVRGVTRVVGQGIDAALAPMVPLLGAVLGEKAGRSASSPRREAVIAALNGVWGQHMAESCNPLAIPMRLRRAGRPLVLERDALTDEFGDSPGRLLVLVHGLCMNDLEWRRDGHDHGASLARDLGYVPLYLHYNSGRHISSNGREFADVMESLLREWPVPVTELVILGHSMGGLVARSACHYGTLAGHAWPRRLGKLVFLGTPHHGAPLERAGNWADIVIGISPYTAPFAKLGKARSSGIKDLRHGSLRDEDWQGRRGEHSRDPRTPVALPEGVRCYAAAATRETRGTRQGLQGDGLVPVDSALGKHPDAALRLPIPATHQMVAKGLDHFALLSSPEVYGQIKAWLGGR
ncbi:MAG: hypothetical protein JNM82_13330 [Rhodocyclaceae bacterium]|nr:hypothetical protein [Rhodocyclaceae bacterium]